MRADDTYNRPIIITLGKELQWRLNTIRWNRVREPEFSSSEFDHPNRTILLLGNEFLQRIVYKIVYKITNKYYTLKCLPSKNNVCMYVCMLSKKFVRHKNEIGLGSGFLFHCNFSELPQFLITVPYVTIRAR